MNPCDLLSFVGSAAYFVLPDFNLVNGGMFGYYSGMLSHMCRFLSQKFIAIGGSIISYFRYMWVYNMYLSPMLVDLGACMEAPCTPLAARDRLVTFSVTVGYIQ